MKEILVHVLTKTGSVIFLITFIIFLARFKHAYNVRFAVITLVDEINECREFFFIKCILKTFMVH